MNGFTDYGDYDGLGLAALVRAEDVSPTELCEEAIRRVERRNPQLNAVVCKMYDLARETAAGELPDGPFRGVPFLLKDLLDAFAGVPLTDGSRVYRHRVPDHDSATVQRYKRTGVVVVGKTNTPELALLSYTEPELFGPCRNPWDTDRTPGGSSGGSASAVAAGMVPLASGNDGGGSLRIPASCCGIFGFKASRGRTPTGPDHGEIWQGAGVFGVMSRSVRDCAAMLDALEGPEPGAPFVIPRPQRPYLEEARREPRQMRVAFDIRSPLGNEVHAECVEAVERAARLLEEVGHDVTEARPAVDGRAVAESYLTMYMGEVAAELRRMRRTYGRRAVRRGTELPTRMLAHLGEACPAGELVASLDVWHQAARAMARFFETYDLYLTPTMARLPFEIGALQPKPAERIAMALMDRIYGAGLLLRIGLAMKPALERLAATPFTQLANVTGLPAMSVPLHWTAENLPCGIQFVAPFGDEATLFQLAGQLERAAPWFNRRPPDSH